MNEKLVLSNLLYNDNAPHEGQSSPLQSHLSICHFPSAVVLPQPQTL